MPAMAEMTLWVRDNPITNAENSANDVKNTFSSWDSCMSKDYCKWPVIIAIIIASLILLSIISCLVRCLCCGLDCCCGIFKCFNACCECCRPSGRRRDRYRDDPGFGAGPYNGATPYGGYQPPPAAPTYIIQQSAPQQDPRYEPSRQYASFDTPAKRNITPSNAPSTVHEDALPAMPMWKDAQAHHVEEEAHEMDQYNYSQAQQAPMLAHQAPAPVNRGAAPTPGAQTEGMGLYNDVPTHAEEGDLGGVYGSGAAPAAAGATAGAAAYGHSPYQQQHTSPAPQHEYSGYSSPPAQNPFAAPQGAASSYYQPTRSPAPPSYHTSAPSQGGFGGVTSPVSPPSTAGGLPSALTPGGGIQPAHQAYSGQDSGVTGGHQYSAYGGHS